MGRRWRVEGGNRELSPVFGLAREGTALTPPIALKCWDSSRTIHHLTDSSCRNGPPPTTPEEERIPLSLSKCPTSLNLYCRLRLTRSAFERRMTSSYHSFIDKTIKDCWKRPLEDFVIDFCKIKTENSHNFFLIYVHASLACSQLNIHMLPSLFYRVCFEGLAICKLSLPLNPR